MLSASSAPCGGAGEIPVLAMSGKDMAGEIVCFPEKRNVMKNPKQLSYTDKKAFEECPLQYKFRKERRRRAQATIHEVAGDVAHAMAAEEPKNRDEAEIVEQLKRLPEAEREEAKQLVTELIAAADELEDDEDVEDKTKETQLSWEDPVTGWKLFAKPDEIGMVDGGRGRDVLQLTDLKSAESLKRKHKDQMYFFALVAHLAKVRNYYGPIKLVVKLLKTKTEAEVGFFSPRETDRVLLRIRWTIRMIEQAIEKNEFDARTGRNCLGCAYRTSCPAFQAWSKENADQIASWEAEAKARQAERAAVLPTTAPRAS